MKSGNKGGRPTKYKQEYCQEFLDYFSVDPYRIETKQIKTKEGSYEVEERVINDFPTLSGFAIKIGVNRDTLLEWANAKNEDGTYKHEEFSGIYKRAKDYQENFLVVTGMNGTANTTFAIFTAKNLINWRNQTDVKLEAEVESNSTVKVESYDLSDRIEQLEKKNDLPESD
ncbi:MAG: hypothetical protein CL674_14430 [Bdellovibrionaceae bacterium]|jgi:hypothetical protein|nr:hypothetical protein [Pseudobdellovibrionaceae bacterium]MAF91193.1 hypothetical protein [Pseudobdellovibrionaceae bacterium]MAF92463.1 hypothetical protein [Pseudobdellovibrionaceae bacterium]QDP47555.1 MAG: putative terminase small subunit [Prokaryotic dsDNA virus sp.]|tara:strand:+ start:7822 stop:8334 length:513 start_codon:yes stop_codon:yes gene_type:complete